MKIVSILVFKWNVIKKLEVFRINSCKLGTLKMGLQFKEIISKYVQLVRKCRCLRHLVKQYRFKFPSRQELYLFYYFPIPFSFYVFVYERNNGHLTGLLEMS